MDCFCPYCNALVNLRSGQQSGDRVRCPRCEELFLPSQEEVSTPNANNNLTLAEPRHVVTRMPGTLSNRAIGLIVLGIMLGMAGVGLTFALRTTEERRSHDHQERTQALAEVRQVVIAPSKLRGLGYVPSDCNVIAGVHVAELMADPLGRDFVQRLPSWAGRLGLSRFADLSPVPLEELDHVILGLKFEEQLLPRVTLVACLRNALDRNSLAKSLHTRATSARGARSLLAVPLGTAFDATLWIADERTLVFALSPQDLESVPTKPLVLSDHFFPPSLRQILENHLVEGTPAWLIGTARDWSSVLSLPFFESLPATDRRMLSQVRSFAAWAQWSSGLSVHLAVEAEGEPTAKTLLTWLGANPVVKEWPSKVNQRQDLSWDYLDAELTQERLQKILATAP